MKAIMVMYDSLRKDLLSCYGGPVEAPNFQRLLEKSTSFECSYVGSLPCMPARRELHTGRYNFLHRSWGPVEPFDDSIPELLKRNGIYTHLTTDHYHYVQDGGATYCGRYSSWYCARGQENDAWMADLSEKETEFAPCIMSPDNLSGPMRAVAKARGWQSEANRSVVKTDADFPMYKTFDNGLDFLDRNGKYDNWFLQIETFDPHEPFFSPSKMQDQYMSKEEQDSPDWPPYAKVTETQMQVERMRKKYYALASFCDEQLGRVLGKMDELNLWEDTMLIVNTDHGFFLGEHDWWGKGSMPMYEELVHTPMWIYDPRYKQSGVKSECMVQTVDIAPTLLGFFGISQPDTMLGKNLAPVLKDNTPVRAYGLFGYHSGPIGITDGKNVLLRAVWHPEKTYEYTLMPTHMNSLFSADELNDIVLDGPFGFTKGMRVMKIEAKGQARFAAEQEIGGDLMFDLVKDPHQTCNLENTELKETMLRAMCEMMRENEAPTELYQRYELTQFR